MSFHLIKVIAVYEMRTLLRSWFFRIFAAGAILGLGIFNTAANVVASGAPLIYRALPASIPYFNLIILNLGQAIVAVFLGSEFLKQDRKNDTIDVIYARSMTNVEYITGKTLGILAVFMTLNLFILIMGIALSFLSNTTVQNIPAYFTYILLISIPTLVFILGLSFFTMVTLKNQAITFILLTGYIALTVFYLNKKAFHIFDYIAYQVPMLYSSITGFSRPEEIIIHRGLYLILGLAFISFTIFKLNRLPQSSADSRVPLACGIVLTLLAAGLAYKYIDLNTSVHRFRNEMMVLNNRYALKPVVSVSSCNIDLQHKGRTIEVASSLRIKNENQQPIDTLIFTLNPSLEINKILFNGTDVNYKRESLLIEIIPDRIMEPGDSAEIIFKYIGKIDERVAFAEMENREFTENPVFEVFRLDKRFGFLKKNFVCLTSQVQWYPSAGPGYSLNFPAKRNVQFINFSLTVHSQDNLIPVSQGYQKTNEDGSVSFTPEYTLPEISLLIGKYQKHSITVDSIDYSIYTIKGNDYFTGFFDGTADTIPDLISDIKKEYEANVLMKYPFHRLMFVEVPVHFALDHHSYSYSSEAVQPEMFLCPEKGVLFSASDFRGRKYRLEKNLKSNNEEVLPLVVQTDLFKEFFRQNFLAKRGQGFNYERLVNWQTFSILPQYVSFCTNLESSEWPVLSVALETYLGERNNPVTSTIQWYEDLSVAEKINLELKDASLEKILLKGIGHQNDERNPLTVSHIVQAKGLALFNLLCSRYGTHRVDTIINRLVKEYAHRSIHFETFNERMSDELGVSLRKEVESWYTQSSLPGFLIKDLETYKVISGENTRYQVRFKISNPEATDGLVTVSVEFNDPNRRREWWDEGFTVDFIDKLYIPAGKSYEAGYIFNSEPARMSLQTNISMNLPNNLIYNFSGFTETRNITILDTLRPVAFFDKLSGEKEVIADNEDDYFDYIQVMSQAYLKSLVDKKKKDKYKYSAIWWNAPREWKAVLRSEFYGDYIHSAFYTRGGSGERTATWRTPLPEEGMYDIYFHVNKVNVGWSRNNRTADYNLTIYHDQGVEKVNYTPENADPGWHYIGTWYFTSDTGRVDISNKSNGSSVFADAVKWVKSY